MWKFSVFILVLSALIRGQNAARLFSFGEDAGDNKLPNFDETSSDEIHLKTPIIYYDQTYDSIFVNSNGILSFLTEIPNFFNIQFPLEYPIIAGLYSDVDISIAGNVWYRESAHPDLVQQVKWQLKNQFAIANEFQPEHVFLVTYDKVAGNGLTPGKVNTFQIAIASDGVDSYVIILYDDGGIQWLQAKGKNPNQPDAIGQAGLLSGAGKMHLLKSSGTDQVRNLPLWSNCGQPGIWMYKTSKLGSDENVILPDSFDGTYQEKNLFKDTCYTSGSICHSSASCVDYAGGFCCECGEGQYGNGINCISNETPIRVTGKVSGTINSIELNDAELHSYTLPSQGRTYTAISNLPDSLGYDIQTVSTIAEGIVWLFAKPTGNTKNGFVMTGGVMNRTVDIHFQNSDKHLTVIQEFKGLDVFNNVQMETYINGETPTIPYGSKIEVLSYNELFSSQQLGMLKSTTSREYTLQEQNNPFVVTTTITFDECQWNQMDKLDVIKMKVGENVFIQYDAPEKIIRYALTAKIGPLEEEDPCIKGREQCGPNSECVSDGDSFRCVCDRGYEQLYDPKIESNICLDKNECETGRHQCSRDAFCINNLGSYTCRCNEGYSGDGYHCASISVCDQTMCGLHAECQIKGDIPICICQQGFIGDGYICSPSSDATAINAGFDYNVNVDYPDYPNYDYSNSINQNTHNSQTNIGLVQTKSCASNHGICSPHAVCTYEEILQDFHCVCKPGYFGDGIRCDATNDLTNCNIMPICSPYATCTYINNEQYQCICLDGFTGNGEECKEEKLGNPYAYDYNYNYGSLIDNENNNNNEKFDIYNPYPPLPANGKAPNCVWPHCYCDLGYVLQDGYCVLDPNWKQEDTFITPIGDGTVGAICTSAGCTCPDGYEYVPSMFGCQPTDNEARPIPECLNDKCVCPPGYNYKSSTKNCDPMEGWDHSIKGGSFMGDGESCNVVNTCHLNAQCIYDSYSKIHRCICNFGYSGDGKMCEYNTQITCDQLDICHINAKCIFDDKELRSICVCNSGYTGDGTICTPKDECTSISDCNANAECLFDGVSQRYTCKCLASYEGDGNTCTKIKKDGCDVLNNCDRNAECIYDAYSNEYMCQCKTDFTGDGYYCKEQIVGCNIKQNCGQNAVCDYDYQQSKWACRCIDNYEGDGFFCKPTISCYQDASVCHIRANCNRDETSSSGYSCQCMTGFTGDGFSCKETPQFESDLLLINQGMAVLRMPVDADDGYGFPIHIDTYMTAVGGDVDCFTGRYYWTDMGTSTIRSSNYDGSEKHPTVSGGNIGSPEDVAIDWVSGNLYWTDSNHDAISVSSLDGNLRKNVIEEDLVNPRGIAVHPGNGLMFWSDWNRKSPKIEVSGLDGTNRRVLVEGDDILLPNSLVVDYFTQNLCWVDAGTHRIECVGIEGYNRRVILDNAKYPFGFALHGSSFFYTDWDDYKIHEVDKYSGEELSVRSPPPGGSGKLYDIAAVPVRCPSVSNVCQNNRGNCPDTHLCLPNGRGGRTCACSTNNTTDTQCQDFNY